MRITSGLANVAAMPRENVESGTNEKLRRSKLCDPFPSFVAVRYFKVRPTGAHLISREGKRHSAEKIRTRKSLSTENSGKEQRRKRLLTAGPGVLFTYARDIRLSQEQKGEPLNCFSYPYAESNGQPITGLTTHFAFRDLSPPGSKNSGN